MLVHAGSGGLGSTVIQLAKHLGATVATTARGENAELVRSLGADVVVDVGGRRRARPCAGVRLPALEQVVLRQRRRVRTQARRYAETGPGG